MCLIATVERTADRLALLRAGLLPRDDKGEGKSKSKGAGAGADAERRVGVLIVADGGAHCIRMLIPPSTLTVERQVGYKGARQFDEMASAHERGHGADEKE